MPAFSEEAPSQELPFPARILVVDDSETFRALIGRALGKQYQMGFAADEDSALRVCTEFDPHLVLLDLHLPPELDSPRVGLTLLQRFRAQNPRLRVIVVSGTHERRDAMEAIAKGASDFYTKPIALGELGVVVKRNLQIIALERENERLATQVRAQADEEGFRLIGSSAPFQEALSLARRVAPTEATVLLIGENGTGKELFARELHKRSARAGGPFVPINCGAIPESLAEGELFGFVKGAFTGAVRDRVGRVQAAEGGTLFLDEIGELSEHMQSKLLRFLQERQIEPLGANRTVEVDARIIAATNRDLRRMVAEGAFREDLYYRLDVMEIVLPPLRARTGDVLPLAKYFVRRNAELAGGALPTLGDEAAHWLRRYRFPGNVRELENLVKRALLMSAGGEIRASDFASYVPTAAAAGAEAGSVVPGVGATAGGDGSLKEIREQAERAAIEAALEAENGNVSRSARRLRVERKSLQRLIGRLGIDVGRFCAGGQPRPGRPRKDVKRARRTEREVR